MDNIPNTLYRGMKFNPEEFKRYDLFHGIPLPNYYMENADGERIVKDGQEWGIYMSDTKQLAEIYGTVFRGGAAGPEMDVNLRIGEYRTPVAFAQVGILYEINTEGLILKRPELNTFAGHQASLGGEYITKEAIPETNIRIMEMSIGDDLLFERKDFDVTNVTTARGEVFQELNKRKEHFEQLAFDLSKMDPKDLRRMNAESLDYLKMMYGEDGAVMRERKLDITQKDDFIKFCAKAMHQVESGLNRKTIKEIMRLDRDLEGYDGKDLIPVAKAFFESKESRLEHFAVLLDTFDDILKTPEDRSWAASDFISYDMQVDESNFDKIRVEVEKLVEQGVKQSFEKETDSQGDDFGERK